MTDNLRVAFADSSPTVMGASTETPLQKSGAGSCKEHGIMPMPDAHRKAKPVVAQDTTSQPPSDQQIPPKPKKSISFHMSVIMLAVVALTVSWDSTTIAVAIPVRIQTF